MGWREQTESERKRRQEEVHEEKTGSEEEEKRIKRRKREDDGKADKRRGDRGDHHQMRKEGQLTSLLMVELDDYLPSQLRGRASGLKPANGFTPPKTCARSTRPSS